MTVQHDEEASVPTRDDIDAAVLIAYDAEDYLLPGGNRDMTKVRERIIEILKGHKVLSKPERESKAITRGQLVSDVFPHLTGRDQLERDDLLGWAVWRVIDSMIWTEVNPRANGAIQRLVGSALGNGYVLCRTAIGVDSVPSVYVTDDRACIEEDLLGPENASLTRKVNTSTALRTMLIMRQPENARRYQSGFNQRMKALSVTAHDELRLAVEAASSSEPADDDNGGNGGNGGED
jgi:hypothetical protein